MPNYQKREFEVGTTYFWYWHTWTTQSYILLLLLHTANNFPHPFFIFHCHSCCWVSYHSRGDVSIWRSECADNGVCFNCGVCILERDSLLLGLCIERIGVGLPVSGIMALLSHRGLCFSWHSRGRLWSAFTCDGEISGVAH